VETNREAAVFQRTARALDSLVQNRGREAQAPRPLDWSGELPAISFYLAELFDLGEQVARVARTADTGGLGPEDLTVLAN
jgi:hypothetical protein